MNCLKKYNTKKKFQDLKNLKFFCFDEESYRQREVYDEFLSNSFCSEFENLEDLSELRNFLKKEAKGVADYLIKTYEIKSRDVKDVILQHIVNQGLREYERLKRGEEVQYKSCLAFILEQEVLNSEELKKIKLNVDKYVDKNLISDLNERFYDFVLKPCVVNEKKLFSKVYFK